jgi:hypothetical protein
MGLGVQQGDCIKWVNYIFWGLSGFFWMENWVAMVFGVSEQEGLYCSS